jgi:hypothetical protein
MYSIYGHISIDTEGPSSDYLTQREDARIYNDPS